MRRNILLTVRDGRISAIRDATPGALPRSELIDLGHCTVVPALVDCSVFLVRSPSLSGCGLSPIVSHVGEEQGHLLEKHVHYCRVHGVLGVADREDIGDLLSRRPAAARQAVPVEIRNGGLQGDLLRISYSPGIHATGTEQDQTEAGSLQRLVRTAAGRRIVVVANGSRRIREALDAGCDCIEQGYGMEEAHLRIMADQRIVWIPSLVRAKNGLDSVAGGGSVCCRFSTRYVAPGQADPAAEAYWRDLLEKQMSALGIARRLGVRVAVGTGAGQPGILHGESVAEEVKLFLKAGYSLEEAIACATETGARFCRMDGLGALRIGSRATFLVIRGTVRQLPRKLAYLEMVYIRGRPDGK